MCCIPQKPKDIGVRFHIFTQDESHTPVTMTWEGINTRRDYLVNPTKVVIVTHGYLERANPGTWIYDFKNGWLHRDASHVIIVDWKQGNRINYFQAASNVRILGMMIGQIILKNDIADKTLAVGFSLGAQIIGEAGKFVQSGGKISDSDVSAGMPANETAHDSSSRGSSDDSLASWNPFSRGSLNTGSSNRDSQSNRNSSNGGSSNSRDSSSRGNSNTGSFNSRNSSDTGSRNSRPGLNQPRRGQKIKECHGLDPAGPFFDGCPDEIVLDKSDCELVQIIHTSADRDFRRVIGILEQDFGSWKKSGHCDYWINCGRGPQPECLVKKFGDFLKSALGLESNETVRESQVSCSHGRAPEIYNAQLNRTCNFKSLNCPGCVEDTNCTNHANSIFNHRNTDYYGFMMDSACTPQDDRNFFVRTSGGSTLCDFDRDSRPNQNTNRNDRNSSDQNSSDRNSSDRNLSDRNSSDRNLSDRNSSDRNLSDRNSSDRNSSDRSQEFRQPFDDRFSNDSRRESNDGGSGRGEESRRSPTGDVSEGRSGFFPLINLW